MLIEWLFVQFSGSLLDFRIWAHNINNFLYLLTRWVYSPASQTRLRSFPNQFPPPLVTFDRPSDCPFLRIHRLRAWGSLHVAGNSSSQSWLRAVSDTLELYSVVPWGQIKKFIFKNSQKYFKYLVPLQNKYYNPSTMGPGSSRKNYLWNTYL